MTVTVPLSLEETKRWYVGTLLNTSRHDLAFSLEDSGSLRVVAMGGVTDISLTHRHAEIYILVDPCLTGKGIGGKAVQWLCTWAFVSLGLKRVYLHTTGQNEPARRLYDRLGFVREGILRSHLWHQGRHVDRHVQGLLREEWARQTWYQESLQMEIEL